MLQFRFELLLGGSWVDVTPYVRQKNTVSIKRGNSDESSKIQPSTAKFTLDNSDDRFNPRNPTSPYFGLLVRNTPVRINAIVGGTPWPRFYGEIYGFEPRWNEDRSDCYVSIEAAGVLRRILQNQAEPKSAYRQWMNNHTGNPVVKHYWPLEDGSDAVEGLPDIGSNAAVFTNPILKKSWGDGEMNDWFPNGVAIEDLNTLTFPCDMRGSSSAAWEVTALMNFPNGQTTLLFEINCGSQVWYIYVSSVTNQIMVINPLGVADISPFSLGNLKDVGPIWMTFRASFVSSVLKGYVSWRRLSDASSSIDIKDGTPLAPLGIQFPRFIKVSNGSNAALNGINGDVTINLSNLSVSECQTGSTGMSNTYAQTKGLPNEQAWNRLDRLTRDQGLSGIGIIGTFSSAFMGRQFVQSYEDHIEEIISSDAGMLVESRSTDSILYSGGAGLSANAVQTFEVFYDELVGSIEPTEDDSQTTNEVSVANKAAGAATVRKQSGEMSINQIGRFAAKLETNNYRNSDAISLGYFKIARGTQVTPRFPSVTVSAAALSLSRYFQLVQTDVGDFLYLPDFEPAGFYDTLRMRVVGIEETFNPFDHRITFNVVPDNISALPFKVADASLGRLGMDDCTTSALVNSTATTIDVVTPTARWTTTSGDWPFDVMIAGERVTVTAVSNVNSTTQRFTVTRSVNGVVKSLPAGSKVELYPGSYLGVF